MISNARRKQLAAIVCIGCLLVLTIGVVRSYLAFPSQLRLLPGEEYHLDISRLFTIVDLDDSSSLTRQSGVAKVVSEEIGELRLELRLLGLIPVKALEISVSPEIFVVPGGQSIGVLMSATQGLVVNRTVSVRAVDGVDYSPAADAGLQPGDIIVELGDQPIQQVGQVSAIVEVLGRQNRPVPVVIERHGVRLKKQVWPVLVEEVVAGRTYRSYKLGLILEAPTAGVGTLTFYDPVSLRFGALGHMITDNANKQLAINEGRIVSAEIKGIQPGTRGFPGEKVGVFEDGGRVLGIIDKNSTYGIFGKLSDPRRDGFASNPIPVAFGQHIHTGPAEILTVIEGNTVERFAVRITSIHRDRKESGKGLVIQIVDPRLLERSGGIVQGMSGSPIIQDGRLIGAVTHVLVNDPTRGYGVLAEWMLEAAGIWQEQLAGALP